MNTFMWTESSIFNDTNATMLTKSADVELDIKLLATEYFEGTVCIPKNIALD